MCVYVCNYIVRLRVCVCVRVHSCACMNACIHVIRAPRGTEAKTDYVTCSQHVLTVGDYCEIGCARACALVCATAE